MASPLHINFTFIYFFNQKDNNESFSLLLHFFISNGGSAPHCLNFRTKNTFCAVFISRTIFFSSQPFSDTQQPFDGIATDKSYRNDTRLIKKRQTITIVVFIIGEMYRRLGIILPLYHWNRSHGDVVSIEPNHEYLAL